MSDIKWTSQQELALNALEGQILLTASAGSGKTAVLARRSVNLLTRPSNPCNIDELLILTFTDAAAAEMRRRIAAQVSAIAHTHPHLNRQLILLDKAQIGTVHSFCHRILREYFYRLDLDGTFEIMDQEEAELLKVQVATELFEDYYRREGRSPREENFNRLVQCYGSQAGDRPLVELLIHLHRFFETLPLARICRPDWYNVSDNCAGTELNHLDIITCRQQIIQNRLTQIIRRLEYAEDSIRHYPNLEIYRPYIQNKLLLPLNEILKTVMTGTVSSAIRKLQEFIIPRTPNRPKGLSAGDIAPIKDHIDAAKDEFKTIMKKFVLDPLDAIKQLNFSVPFVDLLVTLHAEFRQRYQDQKRLRNTLDFSDLEHNCLRLLRDEQGLTDVARQLNRRFKYILVDEYQDIAPIQEAIIQCVADSLTSARNDSDTTGNLFMVGDAKQSIYGFRRADPEIFLDKFNAFTPVSPDMAKPLPAGRNRIDLNQNFRARQSLIHAVNAIFSRCMTADFAGLDYDKDSRLSYGAAFYDEAAQSQQTPGVELHFIERKLDGGNDSHDQPEQADNDNNDNGLDEPVDLDVTRREALMVARRIRQMAGTDNPDGKPAFDVLDNQTKRLRPVQYRDIVILLRSMKMRAELWCEVLGQMGIPVHAELGSGYFVATEIQDMISVLKLLDNPQQDIPLASVLRSPLVGLNESQLVEIRHSLAHGLLYHALCAYSEKGRDEPLKTKLTAFLNNLGQWRQTARRGNLSELIWKIYTDTSLLAYVSGLPQGRQRYRNLLHLHDVARRFDSFNTGLEGHSLSRFLRFVQRLREEEGDFGPAPVLTESDNVVRIISIHKSKGLEFPVVIVAGLDRKFNLQDSRRSILFDSSHGPAVQWDMGLNIVDPFTRDRWNTLPHNILAHRIHQRQLKEEMRILYVAFTRAREKLLLVGSIDLRKKRSDWQNWRLSDNEPLPTFHLSAAQNPLDWLGPALAPHPDMQAFWDDAQEQENSTDSSAESLFEITIYNSRRVRELLQEENYEQKRQPAIVELDKLAGVHTPADTTAARQIISRVDWTYPHATLSRCR
ncbi:MAG: helicase-exonuclease AddAB subunit AddA, partial [Sedimentisphaerales bacterium]|nr:helicase-exonuclease AddAB subunit AddA [Sedimentisphaerales bacterium]